MKKIKTWVLVTAALFIAVSCGSIPKEQDLQQLSSAQLSQLLPGHTLTYRADWGRWAEYFKDDLTGVSRAWGSWGMEEATSEISISQGGEVCWTYRGEPEWAQPNLVFCELFYTDNSGSYYIKNTKNTWKSEDVGRRRKVEIVDGDKYGLTGN